MAGSEQALARTSSGRRKRNSQGELGKIAWRWSILIPELLESSLNTIFSTFIPPGGEHASSCVRVLVTFGWSLLTLFRCSTGASWNGLMHVYFSQGYWSAVVYFISFFLLTNCIMFNIVVAIILENFSYMSDPKENNLGDKNHHHAL